ncbi:hypothetical protein EPO56_02480 [Patescibacteria group bacterium]|nr:MAG: hypothetical protein EPO56_02480 [Patescibacteria group bacterium]
MRLLAPFVASCFAFCVFLLPTSCFASDVRALIDISTGRRVIQNDDIVNRSSLSDTEQVWSFHFAWPEFVPNSRARLVVFRGVPGSVDGGELIEGTNYFATNQQWPAEETTVSKTFYIPSLGDFSTEAGIYTALLADTDNLSGLLEWIASDGTLGVEPNNYSTLTFYYNSEDEPVLLTGAVESVTYRGKTILAGDTLYRDDLPPPDTSISNLDQYWNLKFSWPNAVPNNRALFMLFRGEFGAVENGPLVEGENYTGTYQVWSEESNEFGKYFSMPGLPATSTQPSVYTLLLVEKDPKNSSSDYLSEAEWFASGGTEGVAPKAYSTFTFQFAGDRPPPCCSSVLFLPGIKGSRLYVDEDGVENKLWEPDYYEGNYDVEKMSLDVNGVSNLAVYVKKGNVLNSAGGKEYYQSFITEMNDLKNSGLIADWQPVSYDWRLSLNDIIQKGAEVDGKIYYGTPTTSPYIMQTLRSLASQSKTGKATIVAHSNGGLVTKALLMALGDDEAQSLIDKVIFVGVPQSGAPQSIGSLLYGYREGIPGFFPFVVKASTAREFAENSPMGYHLLPSEQYFDDTKDSNHPIVIFDGERAFKKERTAYGPIIDNYTELGNFLLARNGGREKPLPAQIGRANVLNSTLVEYAKSLHETLDVWIPPANITVYQIAGWGVNTVAGIEFYDAPQASALTAFKPVQAYRPLFVEDGDYVVPISSALMMSTSTENVKRYWVNLSKFNRDNDSDSNHGNILEVPELRQFIKNIFDTTNTLTNYVQTEQPAPAEPIKKLRFFLHSPLTLELYDSSGNHVGQNEDGSFDQEIPDVEYGEFGDVQYIIAPQGPEYRLVLNGLDVGTFSLDIQEVEGGSVTMQTTLANIPTTENTIAALNIGDGIETASELSVDEDGDGTPDITLQPLSGETVIYEEPEVTEESPVENVVIPTGGGPIWNTPIGIVAGTSTIAVFYESTSTQAHATATPTETFQALPTKSIETPIKKPEKTSIQKTPVTTQTASAFSAVSQQRGFLHFIREVYNGLWSSFKMLHSLF